LLRYLHSIFRGNSKAGSYPKSLVLEAIERAVDGTDPWIRAVSGYRKKLRPAVLCAMDHVVALVDALPPTVLIEAGSYDSDNRLRVFFSSRAELQNLLAGDPGLNALLQGEGGGLSRITALLAMEKQEKTILGSELSGQIVLRDVPQVTVCFQAQRLLDPAPSEEETRRQLKRRAYDHLLSIALRQISGVKSERDKLARHRALLQAKLNLLQRGDWGFEEGAGDGHLTIPETEARLKKIEASLLKYGGDDRMLEVYLETLAGVLCRPEKHIWARKERVIVDRMGIKRSQPAQDTTEVELHMIGDSEGRNLAVSLVDVSRALREPR